MGGKRQRWTRGAVVSVPLGDGFHTYAQMLDAPEYAFFDSRTAHELPAPEAVARPILFRLWVMRLAHSSGHWPKVGAAPVADELMRTVRRYNQDKLRLQDIRLTFDGFDGPLGCLADCEGLECSAVWDAAHVEDRLRSHYAGVPCKWTLSLRPKVVTPPQDHHRAVNSNPQ